MPVGTLLEVRRGTAAAWTSANPTLSAGEFGYETNTGKVKIGDGSTAWVSLAYLAPSTATGTVTTTGSPASGNLTKFSGATSITNGDLSGDVTTSSTLAATVVKINGVPLGSTTATSANVLIADGTNWVTRAISGDATISNTGTLTLASTISAGGPTGDATHVPQITYDAKGRLTAVSSVAITGVAPGGSAGGDLTGTYPNPTITPGAQRNIARQTVYPPFTPSGVDDEFDDASFSGWTKVNDGGATIATDTEDNDVLSILLPGGDTAAHLQAYLKSATVNVGDIIQCCWTSAGTNQAADMAGLIMADGNTYNSGVQVTAGFSISEGNWQIKKMAGFNSQTSNTNVGAIGSNRPGGEIHMRLKYTAANSWRMYVSSDDLSWAAMASADTAITMTPSYVGFFATTWGGARARVVTFRYFRKTT